MSRSTFKPAIFRRWRPLAVGAAVLVIIELGAGVTLVLTDLLMRPPTAVLLNLKDGQREVGLKQSLSLTFSRPVLPSRVESSIRIDPTIDGALKSVGSDHRHFSWTPAGPWTDLTTYTVTVLPFQDGNGVATAEQRWRLTTAIVPRVTSLTTENGTATADGSGLPIASKLKLVFNAAMAPTTVKLLLNGTAADLTWSDDGKVASFSAMGIPAGGLDLGLGAGGKDKLGHLLDDTWKLHLAGVELENEGRGRTPGSRRW